jgi:hypothetical protein
MEINFKYNNMFGLGKFINNSCYCSDDVNINNNDSCYNICCYDNNIINKNYCKHKNLCDTIINNSKNFNTLVKEILINYVNLMIELYK